MNSKTIGQFLIIVILAGILGGAVFGFLLSLLVLSLYYNLVTCIVFSFFVFPFYIWSFWKQFKKRRWFVIIRNFFAIFLIACFLTVMFSLEEGIITFNNFDWLIIYICLGFVILTFTTFVIISEYFPESRIYKEGEHIINGMILSGLLPEFDDKNK